MIYIMGVLVALLFFFFWCWACSIQRVCQSFSCCGQKTNELMYGKLLIEKYYAV